MTLEPVTVAANPSEVCGGHPGDEFVIENVTGDDGPCGNHRPSADRDARYNHRTRADAGPFSNDRQAQRSNRRSDFGSPFSFTARGERSLVRIAPGPTKTPVFD